MSQESMAQSAAAQLCGKKVLSPLNTYAQHRHAANFGMMCASPVVRRLAHSGQMRNLDFQRSRAVSACLGFLQTAVGPVFVTPLVGLAMGEPTRAGDLQGAAAGCAHSELCGKMCHMRHDASADAGRRLVGAYKSM